MSRWLRGVRNALVYESREGRAAEIAGWANFCSSALFAAAGYYATHAVSFAIAAGLASLVSLRLALAHRTTVRFAAAIGTVAVATVGGALAWLFAHALESWAAPPLAGALGAILGGALPARAYAQIAKRRAEDVPDSLLTSASLVPPSGR